MQCLANGVTVNDCPCLYCADPADELHAIVTKDKDGNKVVLLFELSGIISHLNVEPVTKDEWDCHACPCVELTHKDLKWDPNSTIYKEQENAFFGIQSKVV